MRNVRINSSQTMIYRFNVNKILCPVFLFVWSFNGSSQVGIGTTSPNENAILDIDASNRSGGLLLPRLGLLATNNPAPLVPPVQAGMTVYNTATSGTGENRVTPGFYYHNGAKWMRLEDDSIPNGRWKLTGNEGTDPDNHFIGTTDDVSFQVRTKNSARFDFTNNGRLRSYNDGDALQPTYSWAGTNGKNMGIFRISSNSLGFSTSGAERMRITNSGNVGIGINPLTRLHVAFDSNAAPAFISQITVPDSQWAAAEFFNPNSSFGTGTVATGYYGVYGRTTNASGGFAGYFSGGVVSNGYFIHSDERWKTNILSLQEDAKILEKVMKLNPKSYNWRAAEFPGMNFDPNKRSFGFLAQELKEIFPDLVVSKTIPDPKVKMDAF
ncbi:tail fiber domain-containing protein [Aequorivita ciconiae]|uniref:tail fiber domain-containing protein n=1 Tax=Aequorivita ciconiae TaxID=2494375 RepID=UPI0013E384D4|nr:tail fiber domain-containing protein [Aequorivita sp. H23M31]